MTDTVEVSRETLGKLYGDTKAAIERGDLEAHPADDRALDEAREVLDG